MREVSTYGGNGDVTEVVPAAAGPAGDGAEERAARHAEQGLPVTRTRLTAGSTELDAPVIGSAGVVRRDTTASEASR